MIDSCYIGDVRDGLRAFIAAGIRAQTCCTSPPYWGLRDYGTPGQIGLEPTIAEYVATMVDVFRLVRDVLADDGTLWLNLGDSYNAGTSSDRNNHYTLNPADTRANHFAARSSGRARMDVEGLKPKDLCGIPWRVAFALQADGWYLRSDIIWSKLNPMPESVTDRPTKSHEYLFLLAKSERYYYDAAAIAEPIAEASASRYAYAFTGDPDGSGKLSIQSPKGMRELPTSRNRRTVWTIATEPYADAHFATFPTALVEPCILAGTSQRGHCPQCGKGWERIVERETTKTGEAYESRMERWGDDFTPAHQGGRSFQVPIRYNLSTSRSTTTGWQPTCDCNAGEPVPGIVLDPFMGSGTVAQVAQSLGRRWIGCELNPAYVAMQRQRASQLGIALTP